MTLAALCLAACPLAASVPVPEVAQGRIVRLADFPSRHLAARHLDIWLPPGYSAQRRYAVLYMHDGGMLFDARHSWNGQEWGVDEAASELLAAGLVRDFMVVGVHNGGPRRHSEYFPQRPLAALPPAARRRVMAAERDPGVPLFAAPLQSDLYLRFLVEELKPHIDANFPTLPGPQHTFVMGSSMGGLISMYAALEYPQVFGGAACLSTHWPGIMPADDNPMPAAFYDYMREHLPAPGPLRLYFDHGTATLDAHYPPLQRQVDAIMRARGYGPAHWQTRVFPGAAHDEAAWRARLHHPLRFLLGRGAP